MKEPLDSSLDDQTSDRHGSADRGSGDYQKIGNLVHLRRGPSALSKRSVVLHFEDTKRGRCDQQTEARRSLSDDLTLDDRRCSLAIFPVGDHYMQPVSAIRGLGTKLT